MTRLGVKGAEEPSGRGFERRAEPAHNLAAEPYELGRFTTGANGSLSTSGARPTLRKGDRLSRIGPDSLTPWLELCSSRAGSRKLAQVPRVVPAEMMSARVPSPGFNAAIRRPSAAKECFMVHGAGQLHTRS